VEIYGRVRRAVRVEGQSQRAVAREFRLSRETVRKMLQYAVPPCTLIEDDVLLCPLTLTLLRLRNGGDELSATASLNDSLRRLSGSIQLPVAGGCS
jgi:hypothetical protein